MCRLSLELLVLGASVQPSLLQSRACACGMWRAGLDDKTALHAACQAGHEVRFVAPSILLSGRAGCSPDSTR